METHSVDVSQQATVGLVFISMRGFKALLTQSSQSAALQLNLMFNSVS